MNICIFGSASTSIDQKYISAGEALGEALARNGHTLVYGGGTHGMMGAAARGFQKGGGYIIGIVPSFFRDGRFEELFVDNNETVYTEDIPERLRLMEQRSDAFLVLPGGAGTYEEFFKVLVSKSLDRHKKPLAIYNIDGYFDPLLQLLQSSVKKHFISEGSMLNFRVFSEESLPQLESYFAGKR